MDWGLGHATRCIPLIRHMLVLGYQVTLAGEGHVAALFEKEFPQLTIIPLAGYGVNYSKKGKLFVPKILMQIPKIMMAIITENQWLKQQLSLHHWDLVISDNRYGLYSPKTKTVFISHQLGLISGFGRLGDAITRFLLYRWVNRFNACWIPDAAGSINIAGRLSHPKLMPKQYQFIGPLSRLKNTSASGEKHVLILLSGPEPQRTMLENILVPQLAEINEQVVVVRGIPSSAPVPDDFGNIHFENHLDGDTLSAMVSAAKAVVCRSGYSSVMDLIKLGKKALLIPTPGQTEQVYLARHLQEMKWFHVQDQEKLDLKKDLGALMAQSFELPALDFESFKKAFFDLGIQ